MWVVKLGGSFIDSPDLNAWLEILGQFGSGRLVIVPGGGIFADQVRTAQEIHQFSDEIAHHMALHAMDQFALFLIGKAEKLGIKIIACRSGDEIEQAINQQLLPIWLPADQLKNNQDIPQNWEMTADSLAAWLAGELQAERLILIKHFQQQGAASTFEQLEAKELIDRQLKNYARQADFSTSCLAADQNIQLQEMLENNNHHGLYIS